MFSQKRQFGNRAEDAVVSDLESKGYQIIQRNYLKKWGEIDIIALKNKILHFVEVKSVSGKKGGDFRPEDNMHRDKMKKLGRTIQTFLAENERTMNYDWVCDLACVYQEEGKDSEIEYLEDIILE